MDINSQEKIVINPYIVSDSNSILIMQNLWDGLFEYDSITSQPKPALATQSQVSEDGLKWTFTLRKAYFSDGSQITSHTFEESWNYLIKGRLASNLDFVEKTEDGKLHLETPDNYTLVVYLNHPVSYLPGLLCQVSLAAIKPSNTKAYSGAYTIESINDSKIILSANKRYWDTVKTPEITVLLGSDFSEDFKKGNIQISSSWIEDASEFMVTMPVYGSTFFYFNAKTADVKTLSSSIPWETIRQFFGAVIPSESLIPQSDAVFATPKASKNPAINQIKIGAYRGANVNLACELIQELWTARFDATVLLDTVPVTVYSTNPSENPYDFCIITWIADYLDPMAFLSLFRSTSSYNLASYSNASFDVLLTRAETQQPEERTKTLTEAEQLLLDSGVVIPIEQTVSTNFVRTDLIEGWDSNPLDIHPFKCLVRK